MASRGRFRWHRSWLQFRDESVVSLASILLPNSHDFCHDRATIAPRTGRDRATIVVIRRSPSDQLETIPRRFHYEISWIAARSRRDRGSIGPRSWSSSTIFLRRWIELQVRWMVTIARHRGCRIAIERRVHRQLSICEDRDEDCCEKFGASISHALSAV